MNGDNGESAMKFMKKMYDILKECSLVEMIDFLKGGGGGGCVCRSCLYIGSHLTITIRTGIATENWYGVKQESHNCTDLKWKTWHAHYAH